MQLHTSRFGDIEIDSAAVISIPDGIPGFASFTGFLLVEAAPDQPFYWLQSTDDGDLAFLAAVPWNYFPDYELSLGDDDESALDVENPGDLLVLNLITVDHEAEAVSANLLAPVVVNQANRMARQIVMDDDLPVRAPLGPVSA
ncbi:MAG: flagellar assembly protein FliW [Acidimicrobiales bacterium]